MQHTQNYQLSRWEKDDRIMMEDFNADNETIDAALKAANDRIDTKADAAALSEETGARTAADSSFAGQLAELAANLGAAGHNCRIAFGSYTGTGTTGAASPNTLQFDFYPVLVFITPVKENAHAQNPAIFIRGRNRASAYPDSNSNYQITAAWTDNSLSWYNTNSYAGYQLNYDGLVYCYAVLGYDKKKEES